MYWRNFPLYGKDLKYQLRYEGCQVTHSHILLYPIDEFLSSSLGFPQVYWSSAKQMNPVSAFCLWASYWCFSWTGYLKPASIKDWVLLAIMYWNTNDKPYLQYILCWMESHSKHTHFIVFIHHMVVFRDELNSTMHKLISRKRNKLSETS